MCFTSFPYRIKFRFKKFEWNKKHIFVGDYFGVITTKKMFRNCRINITIILASITLVYYWLRESTQRKNQESEPVRQFIIVFKFVLAAPATVLEPCVLAFAFPLDHFSDVERGDLLHG